MSIERNREPKGIPSGGQYAAESRPENGHGADLPGGMSDADWEARAGMSLEDLRDGANKLGQHLAKRTPGLDADAIAGDTIVEFIKACKSDKPIRQPREYLKTKARSVALHHTFGTSRGPDITAMTTYLTRRGEWQVQHSSIMTPVQEDVLATSIRQDMIDAGKQAPTINFHRRSRLFGDTSLDAMMTDEDGRTREVGLGDEARTHHHDLDPMANNDVTRLSEDIADATSDDEAQRQKALTRLWGIMADGHGAPDIDLASQSDDEAAANAKIVQDAGGAGKIASQIVDGHDVDPAVRDAFGAPWRSSGDNGVTLSAEVLVSNSGRAEQLWDLANKQSAGGKPSQHNTPTPSTTNNVVAGAELKSFGGAARLARGVAAGKVSPEARRALLMPWKNESVDARRRALTEMLRHPEKADQIWQDQHDRATLRA